MSTVRKQAKSWNAIVRVQGHPYISKTFKSKTDATRWANITEVKLRRDDAGISKVKFPKFEDLAKRYIEEISPLKKCHKDEKGKILQFIKEPWAMYPVNRIMAPHINKWKEHQLKTLSGGSVNRKLDVLSSMYTTFKREWGYPVENPVLSIRRPRKSEPRDRRLSDVEIKKLLMGNRTSPVMKSIIEISLETGMRLSEILRAEHAYLEGHTLKIPIAKTKPRVIPLTNKALRLLKDSALPFQISKWQVSKQFKKLCIGYGIKGAVFHDCRRNALTNFMKDKGLNVPETMKIAGHSDPRMLLRIYNNLEAHHVAKKLNNM
ncbi:site-specific integrase [Candidatus Pelagibacter bacterium]|jgi:integrase|nr:site-specific integrase [Candidatus Pelagibacter bacterium]